VDDGPVRLIKQPELVKHAEVKNRSNINVLYELLAVNQLESALFIAHNAGFEQAIWRHIMVKRYGFAPIPIKRWRCTLAKCVAHALPAGLFDSGRALGLETIKDASASRTMLKLSKPRKESKFNKDKYFESQKDYETLYQYNMLDVEAERAVDKELRDLTPKEQEIWFMDQRINQRGVQIDVHAVDIALDYIEIYTTKLKAELVELTNGYCKSHTAIAKMREFLLTLGVSLPSLDAVTVAKTLAQKDLPDLARKVLGIRQQLGKSSTAKYMAMKLGSDGRGRVLDLLAYHAASTGRWGGRRVQPQNMPRGDIDSDYCIKIMLKYDYEMFELLYPDVLKALSASLRGMIIPKKGYDLIVSDYASVEARGLAWLVDDKETLEAFRTGKDVYNVQASEIFGYPVNKKDHPFERQIGKVAVLALGYQGAMGAFGTMAKGYGIDLEPVYDIIWPTASQNERESAENAYDASLARLSDKALPLTRTEGLAADIIKQRWRKANQKVVRFWYALEAAALDAVLLGRPQPVGKVIFFTHGAFLYCKLPSGRCLAYFKPKVYATKNKRKPYALTFVGTSGGIAVFLEQSPYGGLWAENITQAVCRDLLAEGMLQLEANGYPVVISVHDEAGSEVPEGFGSVEEFNKLFTTLPDWADGFPLSAEGWRGKRYKK
jgi:DNA polymerase